MVACKGTAWLVWCGRGVRIASTCFNVQSRSTILVVTTYLGLFHPPARLRCPPGALGARWLVTRLSTAATRATVKIMAALINFIATSETMATRRTKFRGRGESASESVKGRDIASGREKHVDSRGRIMHVMGLMIIQFKRCLLHPNTL